MFSIRLHRARKAAGLSLRDLGERVGVSHAAIKKYEDGIAMPSSDILIGLSRALQVRTEYFFRPETVDLDGIEYRKRSSLPKKRLDTITHEVIDQIERRVELENLFPQSPVKAFDTIEVPDLLITAMNQIEEEADRVRECFRTLRTLRDRARADSPELIGPGELSMGMSHDYAVAIEEGATYVRVGTAIFGARSEPYHDHT